MLIGLVVFFLNKEYQARRIEKKIRRMKNEKQALIILMKKTQTERYKENKIPQLGYNIKMNSYNKRMDKIKQEIPLLEENLKKEYHKSFKQRFANLKEKIRIKFKKRDS